MDAQRLYGKTLDFKSTIVETSLKGSFESASASSVLAEELKQFGNESILLVQVRAEKLFSVRAQMWNSEIGWNRTFSKNSFDSLNQLTSSIFSELYGAFGVIAKAVNISGNTIRIRPKGLQLQTIEPAVSPSFKGRFYQLYSDRSAIDSVYCQVESADDLVLNCKIISKRGISLDPNSATQLTAVEVHPVCKSVTVKIENTDGKAVSGLKISARDEKNTSLETTNADGTAAVKVRTNGPQSISVICNGQNVSQIETIAGQIPEIRLNLPLGQKRISNLGEIASVESRIRDLMTMQSVATKRVTELKGQAKTAEADAVKKNWAQNLQKEKSAMSGLINGAIAGAGEDKELGLDLARWNHLATVLQSRLKPID